MMKKISYDDLLDAFYSMFPTDPGWCQETVDAIWSELPLISKEDTTSFVDWDDSDLSALACSLKD